MDLSWVALAVMLCSCSVKALICAWIFWIPVVTLVFCEAFVDDSVWNAVLFATWAFAKLFIASW